LPLNLFSLHHDMIGRIPSAVGLEPQQYADRYYRGKFDCWRLCGVAAQPGGAQRLVEAGRAPEAVAMKALTEQDSE